MNTQSTELNSEHNRAWAKWRKTAIEWLAVIISSASLIISLIALSGLAVCIAVIYAQDAQIEEISTKSNMAFTRLGRIESWLTAHGIDTEEIYDE